MKKHIINSILIGIAFPVAVLSYLYAAAQFGFSTRAMTLTLLACLLIASGIIRRYNLLP